MLKIDKISKIFDKGSLNEKEIFKDFSLEVKEGDFVTIIGSNGAGKSSLFNAIFGTFIPDEGHIYLDGEEITDVPSHKRARNIGYLFQDPRSGTAPNMTIEENLFLAGGDGGWLSGLFGHASKGTNPQYIPCRHEPADRSLHHRQ